MSRLLVGLRRLGAARLGAAAACAATAAAATPAAAHADGAAQGLAQQISSALAEEEQQRAFQRLQAAVPARRERSDRWYKEWLEQQLSARVNLEEAGTSFNDDLILQYLYDSFRESPAGKYIEQSVNTDGVELDQFIQGMYDRSTGLDLDKDKTEATLPGVPANAAKPRHI